MTDLNANEIIEKLAKQVAYFDVLLWLEQTRVPNDLKNCSIWDDLTKYIEEQIALIS